MPRGDKSSYSNRQKRMARHIEDSYENRGVGTRESARRAWSTVNKETGGAKKSARKAGSSQGKSLAKRGASKARNRRQGRSSQSRSQKVH